MTSRAARETLRFTHLEVTNWRNFTKASVPLGQRVFLVGPNASGKSNLLDVFRFLQDITAVGGGFQFAVEERGGVSRVRSLSARRNPTIRVAVRIGTEEEPERWGYDITFGQQTSGRRLPQIQAEHVTHDGDPVLERRATSEDAELRTQTMLEQVASNRDFREISEFLRSVRYLHILPQLIREPERATPYVDDPFGSDFLEQVARTNANTKRARLRRIAEALRVAIPQLEELEEYRDETGTPHLRGRYQHWRGKGAWQDESQFSDGTLRLLGLLWVLQDGSGPVLLEEPELSLHPEVVSRLPQLLQRIANRSGRQAILSTHSTDLFLDEGIALDEVLILTPRGEGTTVSKAEDIREIGDLLEGGGLLLDAILAHTRPPNAHQLALFE
ncbi:MAG: AAA family ATPase [Chloroflexota bacterium]|nr:AAA family ATPase [Chloroflexota bacterium]